MAVRYLTFYACTYISLNYLDTNVLLLVMYWNFFLLYSVFSRFVLHRVNLAVKALPAYFEMG